MKNFINISDVPKNDLRKIIDNAKLRKKKRSGLTKNQYTALLAKGNGPLAKRAWGNQSDNSTNPNISGLSQDGNTLICNSDSIISAPTSSSNVPGPIMNLYYNPNTPLVGYIQPNKQRTNIGMKWPQRWFSPGNNGFPNGKSGTGY